MEKRILILVVSKDQLEQLSPKLIELGLIPENLPNFENSAIPRKLIEAGLLPENSPVVYRRITMLYPHLMELPLCTTAQLELEIFRSDELLIHKQSRLDFAPELKEVLKNEKLPFFYDKNKMNKWKQRISPSLSQIKNRRLKISSWRTR